MSAEAPYKSAASHVEYDRGSARGLPPVTPGTDDTIEAVLPYFLKVVADMVCYQRLTGCRPAEVCIVRPSDIDASRDLWLYTPEQHKGRQRIAIGPRRRTCSGLTCFVPAERLAKRHAKRKTKLSYGNRPTTNRKSKPKRAAGDK